MSKNLKNLKWAQCGKVERAFRKAKSAETMAVRFSQRTFVVRKRVPNLTITERRELNRYNQLLQHWLKLKECEES
jgi:uncharacterized protein YqiB (DUF1249 family)